MTSNIFLIFSGLMLIVNYSKCANYERDSNVNHQLSSNRRSFIRFIDEDKLMSYLSSFGGNPNAEESRKHMVYKRASGRIKKVKKNSTNNSTLTVLEPNKKKRSEKKNHVPKNFTLPSQLVKFELEDAKYSEEYEQLKNSRKLRVKRSAAGNKTNVENRKEKQFMKEKFVQPKEFLKFVLSDAIIAVSSKASANEDKQSKGEKKIKREVSATDSTSSDTTRKIKITHPLSSTSRIKHVSFEELPSKIQKVIESTISDAILKGKASDGDYLKFFYGDRIIKVPVSLSKYISPMKETPSKGLSDYYSTIKTQKFQKEDVVTEAPFLPVSKNTFAKYQSFVKHEVKPYMPEKPQSYANYVTPIKENPMPKIEKEPIQEYPAKKSIYYYSNENEQKLSSPVIYESPSQEKETKEIIRESIPITEDFNESKYDEQIYPTSYMEYDDGFSKKSMDYHEDKNYAFGYHVSDYKSGNNFGHTQSKNNKEIKGEYSILLPDGRVQTTKYFADDSGFHADVSYQNIH
ncbi:probable serine/threonine-protein kinase kinX [Chironomus tepperi]|uniref:probable serine/threonine-protein kinase kinX n=1 Tax=Chironomus tepperi TaxID=113505 RepID=UPI00391F7F5C